MDPHLPPPDLEALIGQVTEVVASALDRQLVGLYVVGSAVFGDLEPATSDLDMVAVRAGGPAPTVIDRLAAELRAVAGDAPLRGLEFVLYREDQARRPTGAFELNLNVGPGMATRADVGRGDQPFWFVLDIAILRETARPLRGPAATQVFGRVDESRVRAALAASLAWHEEAGDRPHATVLTACRAWHRLEAGRWRSKTAAGRWALERDPAHAGLIQAALARRRDLSRAEVSHEQAAAFAASIRLRLLQ